MKRYGALGPLSDPPQLGEYEVVLAWQAKEAIAEAERDMLARCIAAVEAQQMYASTVEEIMVGFDCAKREILRALRALPEKP